MSRAIDSIIAYRVLKLLVTPFDESDAFRLGIIDAKGKELKKMGQLNTVEERDAYTLLHRLVFRLKRIIEKVPIENKKILSFAAALSLIKEHYESNNEPLDLEFQYVKRMKTNLTEELELVNRYTKGQYMKTFKQYNEELAGNAVGRGAIAGIGVGAEGEPGLTPKQMAKYKKRNQKNAPVALVRRKNV